LFRGFEKAGAIAGHDLGEAIAQVFDSNGGDVMTSSCGIPAPSGTGLASLGRSRRALITAASWR
jgi:hypothetical protein